MALSHVDLIGYPHTACIHLMACLVDGRSQTLLACQSAFYACLDGHRGCQWPHCCINGIRYCPCLSRMLMRIGSPLHIMRTSSSLNTLTPSFVKTETVPLSDVLPTLIRDVGNSWNVSACLDCADSFQKGSWVNYLALLVPPFATPTRRVEGLRIGRPALRWSYLLM
jgi:hypothetical protein